MSVRTVRMGPEDEAILQQIQEETGWTASDVLKRGLRSLQRESMSRAAKSPFEIYESLDLGPGGYAAGPASESRETARRVIAAKHKR